MQGVPIHTQRPASLHAFSLAFFFVAGEPELAEGRQQAKPRWEDSPPNRQAKHENSPKTSDAGGEDEGGNRAPTSAQHGGPQLTDGRCQTADGRWQTADRKRQMVRTDAMGGDTGCTVDEAAGEVTGYTWQHLER